MIARIQRYAGLVAIAMAGIIALGGLSLFLLSLAAPELAVNLGVATGDLIQNVSTQTAPLAAVTGFHFWLDVPLLIGSYLFVSLLLWLQQYLADYFKSRRHFQ